MSCFLRGMQLTPALPRSSKFFENSAYLNTGTGRGSYAKTSPAIAEIKAYIALRDRALSEAAKLETEAALKRAQIANDFVVNCLKPARIPYQAQCLPEAEAAMERERCRDIELQLTELQGTPPGPGSLAA